ncbi:MULTISPECIES: CbiQ family ECF transporter T component [unclassified Thermosynechococcus]|uniref:energy-coupling factor transporter transmembrane component T family protein n=1 Tax=unclassified Thermosynechococcus TaxID=2622553 RepID=UPI0028779EA3|nr:MULTISPECIES: CbiQ family ECF transporter T component [unclassified Thermosynechococcus]WNC52625.1 CbiQ family ECF transporter T component [Thermosynechococcus sp. TG215]WNC57713.1 CbiQ family ECF transporter T component [Thermosynechococcus sp. TG218]
MDLLRSLPLGLYLEQPVTWLHRLDPRVKLAWLMTFLLAPILADVSWRLGLVVSLILLTLLGGIPARVWRRQLLWLLLVGSLILVITALMPDGMAVTYQPRRPLEATAPPTSYSYILWQFRAQVGQFPIHLQVSQRSLDLGLRLSTLLFTLLYSTHLFLLTTAPEEVTAGLENLMQPLKPFKLPVAEIALTLTLSLRFIPLVLEEVQNLSRSVRTRAINWRLVGIKGSIKLWLTLAVRLLDNLLLRAEQVACAMQVRGFQEPGTYDNPWHHLRLQRRDWLALGGMGLFWLVRLGWLGVTHH